MTSKFENRPAELQNPGRQFSRSDRFRGWVTGDDLRPGDVVETGPGAWRVIVDVGPATHPVAEAAGALRVDVLGWESGRPFVLTRWPNKPCWYRVGTIESLGWAAPAGHWSATEQGKQVTSTIDRR